MKKFQIALIFAGLLAGMAAVYVIRNWDPYRGIPQVTLVRLNAGETEWYAEGIQNYDALVTVAFATEQRQYEIEVRAGHLSAARYSQQDEETGLWGPFSEAQADDAAFFTIPGIFATVRAALFNEDVPREVLRMELDAEYSYPAKVFLGEIIEEGAPVEGTGLLIEVVGFEEK
ncbi:MAG TPA: hypothetical protein VMN57_13285 [Anaerolineales bacterium]|nr:hypothetical protein [Anaerolineales bacterium]